MNTPLVSSNFSWVTDSRHSYGYQLCSSFPDLFFYLYEADLLHGVSKKTETIRKVSSHVFVLEGTSHVFVLEGTSHVFVLEGTSHVCVLESINFASFYDFSIGFFMFRQFGNFYFLFYFYLDPHLGIDSEVQSGTKYYDRRDDFNFLIVNVPFMCSNIPVALAYWVYISELNFL
jgi:hypothetical protein